MPNVETKVKISRVETYGGVNRKRTTILYLTSDSEVIKAQGNITIDSENIDNYHSMVGKSIYLSLDEYNTVSYINKKLIESNDKLTKFYSSIKNLPLITAIELGLYAVLEEIGNVPPLFDDHSIECQANHQNYTIWPKYCNCDREKRLDEQGS